MTTIAAPPDPVRADRSPTGAASRVSAAAPDSALHLFPPDSLLERGRSARKPLRPWAEELVQILARSDPRSAEGQNQIAGCMNNTALIEVFLGSLDRAQGLCELQLAWVEGLPRRVDHTEPSALALQPWVNLGRLLRMQRRCSDSLSHFSLLAEARAPTTSQLGPVLIEPETWTRLLESPEVVAFLESVYVMDSTKSLQSPDSDTPAYEFLQRARSQVHHSVLALLEAELVVLARMGRIEEAWRVAQKNEWSRDPYTRQVRLLYRVSLASLVNGPERSRGAVLGLAERLLQALPAPRPSTDTRTCRLLARLGRLARFVGADACARRIAIRGVATAQSSGDCVHELEFLEALLEGADLGSPMALRVEGEREALLDQCLYRSLLRSRGRSPQPNDRDGDALSRLRAALLSARENRSDFLPGLLSPPEERMDPLPESALLP